MSSLKTYTATFSACSNTNRARISNELLYASIADAYAAAAENDVIEIMATNQVESPEFQSAKNVILKGGYDGGFE